MESDLFVEAISMSDKWLLADSVWRIHEVNLKPSYQFQVVSAFQS